MSVVWVIEKSKPEAVSATSALMGDFAVRVFASLQSFVKLLRLGRKELPRLLVIDYDDCGGSDKRVYEQLNYHLASLPKIFLFDPEKHNGASVSHGREKTFWFPKPFDNLQLSAFVSTITRANETSKSDFVQFKDILLDFARTQVQIIPEGEPETLPLKEAQLLKLLIEKSGKWLTRDDIKKCVWNDVVIGKRTIDSHISRLRKRLDGAEVAIESKYGGGYSLR